MYKSFEIESVWWVLENPTEKTNGTLKYSINEGFNLYLLGRFGKSTDEDKINNIVIIQGFSKNGKRITSLN